MSNQLSKCCNSEITNDGLGPFCSRCKKAICEQCSKAYPQYTHHKCKANPTPPASTEVEEIAELKDLLLSNGWKHFEELNGFRKESSFTIPMFSTDQEKSYDSISDGNLRGLEQAITRLIQQAELRGGIKALKNQLQNLPHEKGEHYNQQYSPDVNRGVNYCATRMTNSVSELQAQLTKGGSDV